MPRGGFIPVKDALIVDFDRDETDLKPGNLSPQAVNKVVNYFSRFVLFGEADDVFDLPLRGAKLLGGNQCAYAYGLSKVISGLDDDSIDAACKLAAFDVAYCQSPAFWLKHCSESDIKDAIWTMVTRHTLERFFLRTIMGCSVTSHLNQMTR